MNQKDFSKTRNETRLKIQELMDQIREARHKDMKEIKAQRVIIDKKLQQERSNILENKRKKASLVRSMEEETLKRIAELHEEKLVRARRNHEEKKLRELVKQQKVLQEISKLEDEESKWLEMLQQRQTMHKEAFGQLENALSLSPKELEQIFKERHKSAIVDLIDSGNNSKNTSKVDFPSSPTNETLHKLTERQTK